MAGTKEEQSNLQWIQEGATGCVFSQIIAKRTEQGTFRWKQDIVTGKTGDIASGPMGEEIIEKTRQALASDECDIYSIVLPDIVTGNKLSELVRFLSQRPPYYVNHVDSGTLYEQDPTLYYGFQLRIDMGEGREAWPMILGPFEWFPPTRRAPVTEIIFKNRPIKGNPTTPWIQIGLDDSDLNLSGKTFSSVFTQTLEQVAANRQGYNRELSRARIAVVIPKADWDSLAA